MKAAASASAAAWGAASPREWRRYLLDTPSARCLDGSPGAYYLLPGEGPGKATFVVHLQGGGWCVGLEDCARRAFDGPVYAHEPSLGSSRAWGPGPCTPALANNTPPCVADGGSGGVPVAAPTKTIGRIVGFFRIRFL